MNFSDILLTLHWWFFIFIFSVGFLPLTVILFKPFFDKGYLFSKILGIIITSYLIFILGLTHIISFNQTTSFMVLVLTSIIIFSLTRNQNVFKIIRHNWLTFVLEELLFLIALFFWTYIHAFSPDIHGLEKFMDFGFINSILRSDYFPPKDMWFTPYFINYYYFGHLVTAVLTKISGLPSSITFNLMLSTIFAFCFTQSFSIAANLFTFFQNKEKFLNIKKIIAGLLSAFLVTFAGNLHILYAFFKAYPNETPVPIWQLPFLPFSFPNGYWYPNATRFIHNTIHEFPMYSWTVADLHGHVLDIPIVLLTIAILLSFFINSKSEYLNQKQIQNKNVQKTKRLNNFNFDYLKLFRISNFEFWYFLLISFLLAIMYMTNAWDGAIYLLLAGLVIIYLQSQKGINYKIIFTSIAIIILGFTIFTIPYNANFKPFVSGIGVLCSPNFLVAKEKIGPLLFEANHCQHSLWWQLLTLYGFFYFFVLSFLLFITKAKKTFHVDQFVLLLIILSTLLIIIPEFIYVKDIYPAHYRANTMFKLVFQAFMMLSLVSGYVIVRILTSIKRKLFAISYSLLAMLLVTIVMLYPYQAINSYYGNLQTYHGLNGTNYLRVSFPTDYAAIEWLNKNIKGQPVILEAQGDSYTDYGRVSTNTGLPTVLGWTVHEWLWRGTYDIPAPRINEIKTIYETKDLNEAQNLLKQYNVKYVFIGALEYQKYPNLDETKFKQLGKLIFQKDNTKIYKITSL